MYGACVCVCVCVAMVGVRYCCVLWILSELTFQSYQNGALKLFTERKMFQGKNDEKPKAIYKRWDFFSVFGAILCLYLDPEVCTLGIVALAMFELDPTQYSFLSTITMTTTMTTALITHQRIYIYSLTHYKLKWTKQIAEQIEIEIENDI